MVVQRGRKKSFINSVKKRNDFAAIGTGTIIIFIAMVLVAGSVVTILFQISMNLQKQAMQGGEQTKTEVATHLVVTDVAGYSSSGSVVDFDYFSYHSGLAGMIEHLTLGVQLTPGSPDVDLASTIVTISNTETTALLKWNSDAYASSVGESVFGVAAFALDGSEFGIIVVRDTDRSVGSSTPILTQGDYVFLTVDVRAVFGGLGPRVEISGWVEPEEGSMSPFAFRTPDAIGSSWFASDLG